MKDYVSLPNPTLWMKLIDLIQYMWDNGYIPTEIGRTVLVLIPRKNAYAWEIALLEVM